MIKSFKGRHTASIASGRVSKKLLQDMQHNALKKLCQLDAASVLDDLRIPPGSRLEPLKEDRIGQPSIRINDQWRICFRFDSGDVHDVEIVDYHRARR